jgi:RAD50-interacting protein 1
MPPTPLDEDQDVRLRDYLDDKLQTLADLESLDSLLINVRTQHSLLQQQLHDAQKDLEEAKKASVQHGTNLKASIKAFEKDQLDIDERLRQITDAETSDEAVKLFEASMDKLNRLDVAKGYVELLQLVESLR